MRKADAKSLERARASPRVYSQLALQVPVRLVSSVRGVCEHADLWRPGGDFAIESCAAEEPGAMLDTTALHRAGARPPPRPQMLRLAATTFGQVARDRPNVA